PRLRLGIEVEIHEQQSGEQALQLELGSEAGLEQLIGVFGLRHDFSASDDVDLRRIELHDHGNAGAHLRRVEQNPDLLDLPDGDAAKVHRRTDLQTLHRAGEVGDVGVGLGEPADAAEHQKPDHDQYDRADHETADHRRVRSLHPIVALLLDWPSRSGEPACSPPLRVRKRATLGSGGSASNACGSPVASWLLVSASRKTELLAIAKMLGSSCVTMTTVAPRLSRSSRIRSSSRRELIGSSPAEGSSRNSTSGSSAMARARPARLRMPPLISAG